MTDWRKLVGKRVLLRHYPFGHIEEARILELSPSGECIKVEWIGKNTVVKWYTVVDFEFRYKFIEVLD